MKAAVVLWRKETAKMDALKAASALEKLTDCERELWLIGETWKEETVEKNFLALPYKRIIFIEGLGNIEEHSSQYVTELEKIVRERNISLAAFWHSERGSELAARISVRLGTSSVPKVTEINEEGTEILLVRKVYNCNLDLILKAPKGAFAVTLDPNAFDESEKTGNPEIMVMQVEDKKEKEFVKYEERKLPESDKLEMAKRILAAGRGCASKESIEILHQLGKYLGAKIGGTRPVVLDAALSYSCMLGMTGSIVKPELSIIAGASGSTPFMIGVRDSRFLVAINQDENAPIFHQCDFGVVSDAEAFLEAFLETVKEKEGHYGETDSSDGRTI